MAGVRGTRHSGFFWERAPQYHAFKEVDPAALPCQSLLDGLSRPSPHDVFQQVFPRRDVGGHELTELHEMAKAKSAVGAKQDPPRP